MTETPAFDSLIKPHLGKLYRLAYRLTGTVADAEDLLQDVLVKLYERRTELDGIEALAPWLGRVLYNQFLDRARRLARQRLVSIGAPESEQLEAGSALATVAEPEFDIKRLQSALARLSVEHRTVLLMHDAEGYKLQEIQQITGVSIGTLKSRLHRARSRLRALLGVEGTF